MTTLGGVNVFGDIYVGQPHNGVSYDNATKTWTGSINPATGVPIGAWSGNAYLTSGARATTFNTGALVIKEVATADGGTHAGGAGIAGNLFVNQAAILGSLGSSSSFANLVAASQTESTSVTTGSLVTLGGAGIAARLNVGGNLVISAASASTSKVTGALVITNGGLGVSGGITAGNIGLDASTTTQESFRIPSGTLLTTAKEGALEFSSGIWYATPAGSSRALMGATHLYANNGQAALAGGSAPTPANALFSAFGGGNPGTHGTFTAQASTNYAFEIRLILTYAAVPLAHETRFSFGGTATYNTHAWDTTVLLTTAGAAPASPVMAYYRGTTTLPTGTTGVIHADSAAQDKLVIIKGHLTTNAGGTIIPQLAVGGTNLPGQTLRAEYGSYFKITPVGGTGTLGVGNFITP
jgi:hypothetical protein